MKQRTIVVNGKEREIDLTAKRGKTPPEAQEEQRRRLSFSVAFSHRAVRGLSEY